MKQMAKLREHLRNKKTLVVPGGYDGLTAKLIEQSGFPVLYMTGAGTSMARGYPDFRLLGMSEMVENARVMTRSVSIPLIADADTGYGNELNVTRTVREYEAAGVAGIHIEDQTSPKRCGHLDGKEVIPTAQFVSKIRAAVAAKSDPDFLLIARTDACAVIGFEEAIARANAALEAGADMAFVEAVQNREELAAVPKLVKGPCLLNQVPGGKTPIVAFSEAEAAGYKIVLLPGLILRAVMGAVDHTLAGIKEDGIPKAATAKVSDAFRRFGSDEWDSLSKRFATADR
jgi:2-methylisocitrate lyase-like PEP mutase family enzyme